LKFEIWMSYNSISSSSCQFSQSATQTHAQRQDSPARKSHSQQSGDLDGSPVGVSKVSILQCRILLTIELTQDHSQWRTKDSYFWQASFNKSPPFPTCFPRSYGTSWSRYWHSASALLAISSACCLMTTAQSIKWISNTQSGTNNDNNNDRNPLLQSALTLLLASLPTLQLALTLPLASLTQLLSALSLLLASSPTLQAALPLLSASSPTLQSALDIASSIFATTSIGLDIAPSIFATPQNIYMATTLLYVVNPSWNSQHLTLWIHPKYYLLFVTCTGISDSEGVDIAIPELLFYKHSVIRLWGSVR